MTAQDVTDQIGQTVNVGDWIAYGVGRGEITTGLILGFRQNSRTHWNYKEQRQEVSDYYKIQVKSPSNEKPSLIDASRKEFIRIPPREAGAEMGERNRAY